MKILTSILVLFCLPDVSEQMYCTSYNGTNTGPSLPDLPDQYSTTIEATLLEANKTLTGYEYFDNPGNRASLKIETAGSLHTIVFNYASDELFNIVSGICTTHNLSQDDNNILFGNVTGPKGGFHTFTVNGALHFSKAAGEKYIGRHVVRGIQCDAWRSCLYWPDLKANFTLDYYFTAKNWSDPVGYPQIPVRALATGVFVNKLGLLKNFTHYYDYIDFRTSISDPTVFETPKGIICKRKKTRPVPQLMNYYHYRQEIIQGGNNKIFLADVWYDKEYRYIRYDYRTATEVAPLFTASPITEIHDYRYGIRYTKDQVSGRCVSSSIDKTSFDVAQNTTIYNQNGSYVIHMKDPMQLFYLDDSYEYTGQRMARGLQCDVFTSYRTDYPVPGVGKVGAVFEYYFLSKGFQEEPDDGSSTPGDVPVYLEVTVPNINYHVIYNFVDFDEEHPDISIFDVSTCYSESSKLQFQVRFPGSYKSGTAGQIILDAQRYFYENMNVNPIRVQDVRLDYDNSQIYISATLIDRSPFEAQFTYLAGKEIEKHDDKTIPIANAANFTECARLCVTNSDFVCNSYDFCRLDPQGICRLSKLHIGDGAAVVINSTCDHFSRTVNGPAAPEPSINTAYNLLQQAVYNGQIQIPVIMTGIDQLTYTAVDVAVTFGWLSPKPLPKLSGQFSYHEEITLPSQKAVFNAHIYYDSDFKLVRYDLVNTQPSPPLFTSDPITTIHDYKSGLAYTLDKKEGNCTIAPINNASFDVHTSTGSGFSVKMKSPIDLFYLNGTYRYAGQRTIRGILCDVFEDKRTDFRFGANPLPQSAVFQFYFMSNDWQEMSEDDGTAVNSQPIALIVSSSKGQFTLTYNFYDFSEQHPDLSNFDIRTCYVGNQIRHFLIKFQGEYHPILDTQLKQFTKNVQEQLSFITTASFLRFQDPQITYTDDGYVYYLATMVEQAPYLLDFTKTSNNVAIYAADKTVNDVGSDFDCAALCRKEDTFDCESFDYCATAKKCQLSKKHGTQSGQGTRLSQICDHYSKTVNNVAPVEPTINTAFIVIKNNVYETGFNVSVYDSQNGRSGHYHAVLFDADILRPDSQATTSENLDHFRPTRRKVIIPNADIQFKGLSVDQCASRCLTEPTIDCQSFDYCFDTGRCLLSKMHPDQNITLVKTMLMCDLYSRKYLDSYTSYPGVTIQTSGDAKISNIPFADFCAQKCSTYTSFSCKSFDYCSTSHTCILKRQHILDMSKTVPNTNTLCTHFSRNYIHDFNVAKAQNLQVTANFLKVNNVTSKDACAKLCIDNSGNGCLGFVYCQSSLSCTFLNTSPKNSKNSVKSDPKCDLYTRKYFPNGSPYGANSQSQQAGSSSSSGYTGGAMAGLAVGMLIPGMVIGAALLYFMRTKRLVEEEQLRMGFVNMSHDDDEPDGIRSRMDHDAPAHQVQYDSPH
ncbi:uncharacterized protein LOC132722747 [Ruditapes philippinarum]|uniref:uncharacterized protein LOC132722747 n=1 Tax=Ruditapes philippinarum TaxID=129788 RepID=UPI00295B10B8|nr:uncharacterized protein LOC132722747 [Ruditapes philippinarum]